MEIPRIQGQDRHCSDFPRQKLHSNYWYFLLFQEFLNVSSDKKHRLKKPREAYFRNTEVASFAEDLPYLEEKFAGKVSHKFLKELGVRGSPDVRIVFSKLKQVCLFKITLQLIDRV